MPTRRRWRQFYSRAIDGLLDITLATRMPEEMRDALDLARDGLLEALKAQPGNAQKAQRPLAACNSLRVATNRLPSTERWRSSSCASSLS